MRGELEQGESIAVEAELHDRYECDPVRPRRRHPSPVGEFDLGYIGDTDWWPAEGTQPGDDPDADPSAPPQRFDDFELVRSIGRGGMGTVYLARDTVLDRMVAVKLLGDHARDPHVRERFAVEVRALARIQHPNVVGAYRAGSVNGRPYLAQELISGPRLDELPRPAPWPEVWRLALGIARALTAVHARRVIHRDVKPSNVMLGEDKEVKLIDFGLACLWGATDEGTPSLRPRSRHRARRLTEDGTIIGTPKYIAPEIWDGVPASERSDVHAMGLILWEMLAGFLPHGHLIGAELTEAARVLVLPPLACATDAVPRPFAALIDRCVRRKPGDRPASAAEVVLELESSSMHPPDSDHASTTADPLVAPLDESESEISAVTVIASISGARPSAP